VQEPIVEIGDDGKQITRDGRNFVRPSIPEWEEGAPRYEELIDALAERDINLELTEVKGIPSGSDLPQFVPLAFAIYLGVKVTDALVDAVVGEVMRLVVARAKLRWRRGRKARGVIYGPDGEVLHEFIFESSEGEGTSLD
jgi:hypothetical protein